MVKFFFNSPKYVYIKFILINGPIFPHSWHFKIGFCKNIEFDIHKDYPKSFKFHNCNKYGLTELFEICKRIAQDNFNLPWKMAIFNYVKMAEY